MPSRPNLPSGTVTLLFTDIEGSTRLLHEIGEAYADALAEHRRALREAFRAHGGVEVDTAGDAFFYAFGDAAAALAAAAAGQQALQDGSIRVRMGLHTGQPMLTDEGYVGIDVHHAARVMAAGHGGQVLASEATARIAADAGLRDLGRHRLKDMTSPEHLYQLGDGEFPALKTLDATNLPVAATALLGRESEVAELTALLTDGHRLVSVTGPGGTGKTRLALQAASELVGQFRDGVFWVPLAAITDPELVLPEVARSLGAGDLMAHVRDRELLLLLDNLEQVQGAAVHVGELLANGPRCRVLATSRTTLHVSGEREFPLGPLGTDDAVVLFCERARAIGRPVEPDATVRAICQRLDGLPLAIELAASRTKLLAPPALLERLDRSLAVLTGGPGDAPQRQRTLRATIEWSHDLLDDDARSLFARLAVFAGGANLESVEEVCEADLDTLAALVDSSLVKVVDAPSGSRFLMLETIREYAVERLAADPVVAERLGRRHAEHYAALLQQLWGERRRVGTATAAIARIDAEHANARAAEEWARRHGDHELMLRILISADALFLRGSQSAFRDHLEECLRSGAGDAQLRGRGHAALAFVLYRSGDFEASDAASYRALELGEESGDRRTVAMAHNYLSNRHNAEGRPEQARQCIQRSLDIWRDIGDDRGTLVCLVNLVDVSLSAGDNELALTDATVALETARRFGDPEVTEVAAVNAALACLALGRLAESTAYNDEALDLARALDDQATVVCCLRVSAALAARTGQHVTAARQLGWLERVRAEIDLTLEPSEKILHEEILRDLAAALGAERLREEMRTGANLPLDDLLTAVPSLDP